MKMVVSIRDRLNLVLLADDSTVVYLGNEHIQTPPQSGSFGR